MPPEHSPQKRRACNDRPGQSDARADPDGQDERDGPPALAHAAALPNASGKFATKIATRAQVDSDFARVTDAVAVLP